MRSRSKRRVPLSAEAKQAYEVWLYNSRTDLVRLGCTQAVGKDGSPATAQDLYSWWSTVVRPRALAG